MGAGGRRELRVFGFLEDDSGGYGWALLLPILGMGNCKVLFQANDAGVLFFFFYHFTCFLCSLVFFSGILAPVHNGSR